MAVLFRWTRFGRAMRAVAQNQTAARLMGISVERVYAGAWVLAAVVGAVAGVLVAPVIFLSTKMGLVVINGFTAAVLGGFGSMPGAVAGGMLLGVLENLAPLYLPTGIRYSVPFLVLIAILVARPRGLSAASSGGRYRCAAALALGARWSAAWPWVAPRYFVFLATLVAVNAVVAIGLNLLSGYTNQLSFGHAGFLAIGAYAAAMLTLQAPALPVPLTLRRPVS